jgi:hypothetical protein
MALTAAATVEGRTLQEFLEVTREELAAHVDAGAITRAAEAAGQSMQQLPEQLRRWPQLSSSLADHLCGFLQENVVTIFAGAWSTYAELRKQARETFEDKDISSTVALGDHDFTWAVDPAIDVLWNSQRVLTLPVAIEMACTVSGLELTLQQGAVQAIASGKCNSKANILCAGYPMWERTLVNVDLPGVLRLEHPIALAH